MLKYIHSDHEHLYKIYELEGLGNSFSSYEIISTKGDDLQRLRINQDEYDQFINRLESGGWTKAP